MQATWTVEEDGRVLAEIAQHPLRLAWAITVHKSQGMSLDAVIVDLSRCFEPGMGYVALSRVRTLEGLVINGMNEAALQVHPEVLHHDRYLRDLSGKAESIFEHTDRVEISRAHEQFLAKVAPLYRLEGAGGRKGKNRKPRMQKLSTYHATATLIKAEKSLSETARERDVTTETIISHIEKLVSGEGEGESLDMSEILYLKKEISTQHFTKIEKALEEVSLTQEDDKPPFLSPVKSLVGSNVSFKEIRLARLLLGYMRK